MNSFFRFLEETLGFLEQKLLFCLKNPILLKHQYPTMEKPDLTADDDNSVRTVASNQPASTSGLAEYTGAWDATVAVHLLKRTVFGVTATDLNHFLSLSMSQAVDELLTASASPVTVPLNNYSSDGYTDPTGVPAWET